MVIKIRILDRTIAQIDWLQAKNYKTRETPTFRKLNYHNDSYQYTI